VIDETLVYGCRFPTACFFSFFKTFLSFSDKSFLEKIQRKILEMVKKFDEKKLKEKIFTSKFFFASTRAKNFVCRSKQKSSGLKFSSIFY